MARKQSDYLAALLSDDEDADTAAPQSETEAPSARLERSRGTTLLDRESALARVASGEVRQVTQLLLDPARVRVWPGNARGYKYLTEETCRDLIDSIIAEGGQKVPALVRRIEGDPAHDYEVIAGTRRHWSISWLRTHSYPEMQFVAQVAQLDDEAAFRFADLENRARLDVSDLERARNYAQALKAHYGNHLSRMAQRLKLSKGWLSKMLKVANIPDNILSAFASPSEVQLKPAYALAQALDDKEKVNAIRREAARLTKEQRTRREADRPGVPATDVLKALLAASETEDGRPALPVVPSERTGRPLASLQSRNRQGMTLRLHAGAGANLEETVEAVRRLLLELEADGKGLQP
jgi:ParB family chromosome partitioning protein